MWETQKANKPLSRILLEEQKYLQRKQIKNWLFIKKSRLWGESALDTDGSPRLFGMGGGATINQEHPYTKCCLRFLGSSTGEKKGSSSMPYLAA